MDKPKPGRDRCVCSYENVEKYPAIMYAKGNRKTRWADRSKYMYSKACLKRPLKKIKLVFKTDYGLM